MTFLEIDDPERLHALIEAILLIETDAELDGLLSRIIETSSRLVGARYGALGVIANDGTTLSHFVTYGLDPEERAAIGPEPVGRGLLGEIIRRGAALRIDELSGHITSSGFPANHPPMHRFLGVPVVTGDGRVFGNLYLSDPLNGEVFSEEDEQLTEAFGRAAGLVIDQELLRSNARALTLTEERERLARDLHDTVIQRLFGVGLALRNSFPAITEDHARAKIENVLDELDMTIQEIRTTIFEIDQDHDVGRSLEDRVTTLSLEIATRLGVSASVKVAPNIDANLGPHCAHHCMQALREILSNVVRHSSATEVDIELVVNDALVEIVVHDNGVGFDSNVGSGRGVGNLTNRARELGGNCTIDSTIGGGTTVSWTANRSC